VIFFRDARVLRASGLSPASVLVADGLVTAVGDLEPPQGARIIEADGAVLGPGFVDLHTHLRDPGQTWKEDIASGTAAAAAGGFTAVLAMPNTDPPTDDAKTVASMRARADDLGHVEVVVTGALTRSRQGLEMADFDGMYRAGVRMFTDDGDSVADAGLMRRILSYLADFPDVVVADHPEDRSISGDGHLNEGRYSAAHGIAGLPNVAEEVVVARDLALAADTGARLHLQHLSTARSVDMVRDAKAVGIEVTCEVTPHHLLLDESRLEDLDTNVKMYPPLRSAEDRLGLVAGLLDGTVDAVATDHAPHATSDKDVPFEEAPRGVIGLETAASACLQAVGGDVGRVFQTLSVGPARIAGLERHGNLVEPGIDANLVLFAPDHPRSSRRFRSKSENSPFLGMELEGRVLMTLHRGRIAFEDGIDG
jgi:dihydroorotase